MVVDALVLAGGRARRFGGVVKPLIDVGGRTILERQLDVLRPRARRVWLSTNDPRPFSAFGLPTVADTSPGAGPLAGIAAALRATDADWLIVVAGDMPRLSGPVIDVLKSAAGAGLGLVIPDLEPGLEPLHAMYHRSAADVIDARLAAGLRKAMDLAGVLPTRRIGREQLVAVDPTLSFRANLNSPEDLVEG